MGRMVNKVAIVTGGAKGIGKATCRVLAEHGAAVAVTDVDDDEGGRVAEESKFVTGSELVIDGGYTAQ